MFAYTLWHKPTIVTTRVPYYYLRRGQLVSQQASNVYSQTYQILYEQKGVDEAGCTLVLGRTADHLRLSPQFFVQPAEYGVGCRIRCVSLFSPGV